MVTFLNYQGSKKHFCARFNKLISETKYDTYIEPFVGSGAILFNLDKQFKHYIINDINEHVISMYTSFRDVEYTDLVLAEQEIFGTFGDIKNDKESWYKFRNFYNRELHFSDNVKKGLYLYFLNNSCINSMLRFGPSGMNSCFGARHKIMSRDEFEHIKYVLQRTTIKNGDYRDCMQDNAVIFVDPPYFDRPTSYTNNFNEEDLNNFLASISQIKSDVIYTDIYSEHIHQTLKWQYIKTKLIMNSSPYAYKDTHQEVAFFNFNEPSDEW